MAGSASSGDPLAAVVSTYLADPEVGLRPEDPAAELRANTWHYEAPAGFDVEVVAAMLRHVAEGLSSRFPGRSGTFYCWYDEQAGRLCCSLTSEPIGELPFGGRYRTTIDATEVLRLAAGDPHPGIVLWEELTDGSDESRCCAPQPFPVWVASLS